MHDHSSAGFACAHPPHPPPGPPQPHPEPVMREPVMRSWAQIAAHREEVERLQRQAADASRAYWLLVGMDEPPAGRLHEAQRRLDEAVVGLRRMGVIA